MMQVGFMLAAGGTVYFFILEIYVSGAILAATALAFFGGMIKVGARATKKDWRSSAGYIAACSIMLAAIVGGGLLAGRSSNEPLLVSKAALFIAGIIISALFGFLYRAILRKKP